jgi:hypothetical protein
MEHGLARIEAEVTLLLFRSVAADAPGVEKRQDPIDEMAIRGVVGPRAGRDHDEASHQELAAEIHGTHCAMKSRR